MENRAKIIDRLLLSLTAILLILGFGIADKKIAIAGSIAYVLKLAYEMWRICVVEKLFKRNAETVTKNKLKNITDYVFDFLNVAIIFGSMFAAMADNDLFKTPGLIIFASSVLAYITFGVIAQIFLDISWLK